MNSVVKTPLSISCGVTAPSTFHATYTARYDNEHIPPSMIARFAALEILKAMIFLRLISNAVGRDDFPQFVIVFLTGLIGNASDIGANGIDDQVL